MNQLPYKKYHTDHNETLQQQDLLKACQRLQWSIWNLLHASYVFGHQDVLCTSKIYEHTLAIFSKYIRIVSHNRIYLSSSTAYTTHFTVMNFLRSIGKAYPITTFSTTSKTSSTFFKPVLSFLCIIRSYLILILGGKICI